ncbi:hypothetical protein [Cytobacillus sp. IB215665]|uniref:hypothetical protein n=1 Tax=Cytobacillus sp. IB215665 TaxID=3097357 RepID=UPI002A1076C8|nr:hypothetical protein [Cytobacillus sp. IB215665]MDX8367463.1 hypothetical protein [Cytobacillus sp. IB215665]
MENYLVSEEFIVLSDKKKIKKSLIGKNRVKQLYMVGGVFFDLLLLDVIYFEGNGKININSANAKIIKHDTLLKLYSLIKEQKPKTFKGWISYFNVPSKNRVLLYDSLTSNLSLAKKSTNSVVQRLRAELLEPGTVSDETVALALLLKASKILGEYFSNYEIKEINDRIELFKTENPQKWSNIKQISKEIEYMDVLILSSAVLI